jgi:hypothetical protein
MKTLYALFFVCLSVPALADVLDVMPIGGDEDDVATVSIPVPAPIEDHSVGAIVDFDVDIDVDNVASATTPAIEPDDRAELEGTSRADADATWTTPPTMDGATDVTVENADDAAGMTSAPTPKVEDEPIDAGHNFSVDDEGREFKLSETIGERSTEAGVWPSHSSRVD